MAKCDLSIELEDQKEVYHPGDEVVGEVVVVTDESVRCDGLTVTFSWRTHGRGSVAQGEAQTLDLFQGEWAGPTNYRYSFRFRLPDGPVTYHGHFLNVGWFVRATADIPWKIDPKAEHELVLTSGPEPDQKANWERQYPNGYQPDLLATALEMRAETQAARPVVDGKQMGVSFKEARKIAGLGASGMAMGAGCITLLAVFGLIFGTIWAIAGWSGIQQVRAGDWTGAIPELIVLAVGSLVILGICYAIISSKMIAGRFGEIVQTVEPDRVAPGETMKVRVSFTPNKETTINGGTVRLEAFEQVERRSGTDKKTLRHVVYDEPFELTGRRLVAARQPMTLEAEVLVPESAPPSFEERHNQLTWRVIAHVDIARFPDWGRMQRIVVMPQ